MNKEEYLKKKQEEIDKLLEDIEKGVKDVFKSDKFKEFLDTMSKFSSYSISNCVLIQMQRPDATLIAGYRKWQKDFERQVQKGEKAIIIIAPIIKTKKENVLDEQGNKLKDSNGNEILKDTNYLDGYKKTNVFDVSQTKGKELPQIAIDLTTNFENEKIYDNYMNAIKAVSSVPIRFDNIIEPNCKGYFSLDKQEIVIKEGLSNHQSIKTAIHELAHSILHNETNDLTRDIKEVQAESVAYVVSKNLGIDTSSYSFEYIASWSNLMEAKELKETLSSIKSISMELTDKIKSNIIKENIIEQNLELDLFKNESLEEDFYELER